MVDFWGPEAAGGHSRPKRGKTKFDIAAQVGAHVCYSLPRKTARNIKITNFYELATPVPMNLLNPGPGARARAPGPRRA